MLLGIIVFVIFLRTVSHSIAVLAASASQITVPHNESDKVARGGLDKMTLVEVCSLMPLVIFMMSSLFS